MLARDGQWYLCDDAQVRPVSRSEVLNSQAYLLFYHAPRRVFEFAGNGGFLMQRALLEVGARSRLVDWVHSDFALASLEYPIALVSDLAILRDLTADVDKAVARRRSSPSRPRASSAALVLLSVRPY